MLYTLQVKLVHWPQVQVHWVILSKVAKQCKQALPSGVEDVVADFVPGEALTADEMNAILDLDSTEGIPQNVIDQYNAQLETHVDASTRW